MISRKSNFNQENKTDGHDHAPAAAAATGNETRRPTGWREWLVRLCLVVVSPLLFFGVMEAGLRLGGYGYPTVFFIKPGPADVYIPNIKFCHQFFKHEFVREPTPSLIVNKPPGTVRIFILGSSAAQGFPEPSLGFGRILEVMLKARYPGVRFEVVNAAMTAINSHVAYKIAKECAQHQPDIFIVYMGNNEVVGPYGPGTIFQKWSPSLTMIRSTVWIRSTRVGQLYEAAMGGFSQRDKPSNTFDAMMNMLLVKTVAADDSRLAATYRNFRQNLEDICGVARHTGAAVVLSTVAVNLRDCPPFASLHRSNLLPVALQEWESLYKEGNSLEEAGRRREAIEKYESAARIDDRFAELQYRMGRCFTGEGTFEEARKRYIMARDLDALRFRADSTINAIIRDVATAHKADGVSLADAEQALADGDDPTSFGTPGEDVFYEHAHANFDGNYLIARVLLDRVSDALSQLVCSRNTLTKLQCAELLALTSYDEFEIREKILAGVTTRPPFTTQFDHPTRLAMERQRLKDLRQSALTPEALRATWKIYQAALAKAPDDWQLHRRIGNLAMECGWPKVAVEHQKFVVDLLPWDSRAHNDLGAALYQAGKVNEAIGHFEQALLIKPDSADAHFNLGTSMGQAGKMKEAIEHFEQTLRIRPDDSRAHNNLGSALQEVGRTGEAFAHFQQALRNNPDNEKAHVNIGLALEKKGRTEDAIAHYLAALRINPGVAQAGQRLKALLGGQAQAGEVITKMQGAFQANPHDAESRYIVGVLLRQLGQDVEALAQFREGLLQQPDYVPLLNDTAWLLATSPRTALRSGEEAVELAVRAVKHSVGKTPECLDTLAAAYAEVLRFDEAVATAQEAVLLARAANKATLADEITLRLNLYRERLPYRETASPPTPAANP